MNSSLSGNLQVIFSASWCACRQSPGCVTRPWTRMQGCMPWTVSSKWQMSQWTVCNFTRTLTSSVFHFLGTCSRLSWHPSDLQSGSRSGKVDNVSPLPKLGSWTNEQEIANNPGCGSVVSRSSGQFLWTSVSRIVAKRIVRPWERSSGLHQRRRIWDPRWRHVAESTDPEEEHPDDEIKQWWQFYRNRDE